MKASVLTGPESSEVRDVPVPRIAPDEVLVRVKACGVCRSELHEWEGRQGAMAADIPGHEPAGVIEQVGSLVTTLAVGERVTCFPATTDRLASYTMGGFAEYLAVAACNVVPIPDGVGFEEALGEPLACLVSGAERTPVGLGDRVALIGCGFMGLAMLQLIRLQGPREIVAVDVRDEALDQALRFGADKAVTPDKFGMEDKALDWDSLENGFDAVFEVSGTQAGLDLASDLVRSHGVISVVGYHVGGLRQIDLAFWNLKAFTLINAHERRRDFFMACMRRGIDLQAAGRIDMKSLVTHRYSLEEVDQAFSDLRSKPAGYIKGIVVLDGVNR